MKRLVKFDDFYLVTEALSIMCMENKLRSGATKAETVQPAKQALYCSFCGRALKVIDSERFCNNVGCINRYKPQ